MDMPNAYFVHRGVGSLIHQQWVHSDRTSCAIMMLRSRGMLFRASMTHIASNPETVLEGPLPISSGTLGSLLK